MIIVFKELVGAKRELGSTESKWKSCAVIITSQLFSSDFELLSSNTFESFCIQLFSLKENGQTQFFKNTLVARDSYEKEHSNGHCKDFSKSGESKDANKSHAECNATHFSGSDVVNQQHRLLLWKKLFRLKNLT